MDFWALLVLSFLTALTGALSPGPLFTFTIEKSLACGRRGWSVGFLAILGHAAIEGVILSALLLGMAAILNAPLTLIIIGIAGGSVLLIFGILYLKDAISGKIAVGLQKMNASCEDPTILSGQTGEKPINAPRAKSYPLWKVAVGGIVVSMSNPYWWLWWATIGLNLVLANLPSLGSGLGVTAFFVGHELGDLSWYVLVSFLVFAGRTKINAKTYRIIILACGVFMLGLGLYFMTSIGVP